MSKVVAVEVDRLNYFPIAIRLRMGSMLDDLPTYDVANMVSFYAEAMPQLVRLMNGTRLDGAEVPRIERRDAALLYFAWYEELKADLPWAIAVCARIAYNLDDDEQPRSTDDGRAAMMREHLVRNGQAALADFQAGYSAFLAKQYQRMFAAGFTGIARVG